MFAPMVIMVHFVIDYRLYHCMVVWTTLTVNPLAPLDDNSLVVVQVAEEAITTTVDALHDCVDLSSIFKGVAPQSNARYVLRSVICYFGHHYQAYAFSEELEQWLLFDDTNIQLVGDWQDVKSMIRSSRLQPSVLFYERSSA